MIEKPPILTSEKLQSFPYDTVTRRLREDILKRVFLENDLQNNVLLKSVNAYENLIALDDEMKYAATMPIKKLKPLTDNEKKHPSAESDWNTWNKIISPSIELNKSWIQAPWLVAEMFFYRRIVEALHYFDIKYDPYERQKLAGIKAAESSLEKVITFTDNTIKSLKKNDQSLTTNGDVKKYLKICLLISLWGNQSDLSLKPAKSLNGVEGLTVITSNALMFENESNLTSALLADDFETFYKFHVKTNSLSHIGIVTDNAGFETFMDFILIDFLLQMNLTNSITLYTKAYPIYVSDLMEKDVFLHLSALKNLSGECAKLAERLENYIAAKKFIIKSDVFFCQPLPLWEFPDHLKSELEHKNLIIVKGDANYRRLIEDRDYDHCYNFDKALDVFPTPILALRTLKSDAVLGLDAEKYLKAKSIDKSWYLDGKWGVMHYAQGKN